MKLLHYKTVSSFSAGTLTQKIVCIFLFKICLAKEKQGLKPVLLFQICQHHCCLGFISMYSNGYKWWLAASWELRKQ